MLEKLRIVRLHEGENGALKGMFKLGSMFL